MEVGTFVLSTCGTSLLTNGASAADRSWLTGIANAVDLDPGARARLDALLAERRERLLAADGDGRRSMSAELNGIGLVLARWGAGRVMHLLVHTDTVLGRATAELVAELLERDGQQVQLQTAAGLRTDDLASFREALAELTGWVEDTVPGYRQAEWTTVFNLTGGFKSINAYLQALGMLHADRCVFVFERSAALMEIPRLPVELADAGEVRRHLDVFRRLAAGYPVSADEVAGVPDSLLLVDEGEAILSIWGEIVWQRVRKQLLGEGLLEPLSPRLELTGAVRRACAGLDADRRMHVNKAIDALAAHLDRDKPLPKANTLKKLQGKPKPPSTHELYLWSDQAAWRLFGHFEAERFVADAIGPHL